MLESKHKPRIHIVEGNSETTVALTCLLEAQELDVACYANSDELINAQNVYSNDVIFVELDEKTPRIFKFLNRLLYLAVRPGIIIACQTASSLEPSDLFPTGRIEVLFHPFSSRDVMSAITRLSCNGLTT